MLQIGLHFSQNKLPNTFYTTLKRTCYSKSKLDLGLVTLTIHNCSVLCHLIEKYIAKGSELFVTFIDLSAAFNSINGRTFFGRNLRI